MKKLSLSALVAVGVLAGMTGANAADLGGNCCADLEERIAELEATTARKGNRKVSLTISGWVAQQVTFWDDGVKSNTYVSDIGETLASNVKFTGSAKISPDWSAGYVLHLEAVSSTPFGLSQTADNGAFISPAKGVNVLQSFWFLKSESLGKISVGLQSSAADNAAILPDGSGSLIPANYVMFDGAGFTMRSAGALTTRTWGQFENCPTYATAGGGLAADCDGVPNNNVRYDTPTFAGFSGSASWGENDIWAVAGRYAGETSGFKIAAAIAYVHAADENSVGPLNGLGGVTLVDTGARARGGLDAGALQVGGYLQHIQTGLFVYGAYGRDYNSVTGSLNSAAQQQKDGSNYYVKAGIRQKWTPLGATVLFGEYGENQDKMSNAQWVEGVTASNMTQWGVGVVQEIDAAAMSMWLVYRNFSADETCTVATRAGCTIGKKTFDDLNIVKVGAIINF